MFISAVGINSTLIGGSGVTVIIYGKNNSNIKTIPDVIKKTSKEVSKLCKAKLGSN